VIKQRGLLASLLLVLIVGLVACGGDGPAPTATSEPPARPTATPEPQAVTLTDDVGNTVEIEGAVERVVSLAPSHTETLYALGLGDRVVGATEYCNYPPEVADKPKVGGFADVDLEMVVGLEPDLVLATSLHMAEVVPALQERGITVFVADPQTVAGTLETILAIGQITGHEEAAETLAAQMQARIDTVQEKIKDAPRPKVFWELGPELYTAGPGSFINDLIVMAGGENVAADADSPWPQLTVETIILKNPDVIVLADHNYGQTSEMVAERPGWEDINAVKEGNVVEITDDDIVSRPGPRIVEGLEFLAKAFHPDLFE